MKEFMIDSFTLLFYFFWVDNTLRALLILFLFLLAGIGAFFFKLKLSLLNLSVLIPFNISLNLFKSEFLRKIFVLNLLNSFLQVPNLYFGFDWLALFDS